MTGIYVRHTAQHNNWDQGGYCNALVVDEDGYGDTCGYRRPQQSLPQRFQSKYTVEAMVLTLENVEDVSAWCGGRSYWRLEDGGDGEEVPEVSLCDGAVVRLGECLVRADSRWQVLPEGYLLANYAPISERDATIQRVREALDRHPKACDEHDGSGGITCGWKGAVADIEWALAHAARP